MSKKRLTWVDAVKGLLMVLVVIGHYPKDLDYPLLTYIYWFHMPAFFVLSGLFFKPADSKESMFLSIKKRFMQLMVPYLFFVTIITCFRYILAFVTGNTDLGWYLHDLMTILFGGRFARGSYGVIWFITTLFFSYLLFLFVTRYLKRVGQILFLIICYVLAEVESNYVVNIIGGSVDKASQTIMIPWNLDVVLIAIVYFAIGYLCEGSFLTCKIAFLDSMYSHCFGCYVAHLEWTISLSPKYEVCSLQSSNTRYCHSNGVSYYDFWYLPVCHKVCSIEVL